ncbi:hypothetical protein MACH01_28970 [Thalassospira tepidiphila]|nr:hypothetical protein MACH01_28970 [Thalassospira tepidiphila]
MAKAAVASNTMVSADPAGETTGVTTCCPGSEGDGGGVMGFSDPLSVAIVTRELPLFNSN